MLQIRNWVDEVGLPAGGVVRGEGLGINWQDGPIQINGVNGAQVEDVIDACIARLDFYQTTNGGKFACTENRDAMVSLMAARKHLDARTARREAEGSEGTHTPDAEAFPA